MDAADPELLEFARRRIAMLLGTRPCAASASAPSTYARQGQTRQSPRLAHVAALLRARASLLTSTEQFVIDVAGVSDEAVAAVSERLPPAELYGFITALYILSTVFAWTSPSPALSDGGGAVMVGQPRLGTRRVAATNPNYGPRCSTSW